MRTITRASGRRTARPPGSVANRATGGTVDPSSLRGAVRGQLGHRRGDGMTPMRNARAWPAAALTCAVLVAAVGCSTPDPTPTPTPTTTSPTATATPTPTVDPAVAEAEAAVLAAYQSYWDVSAAALAAPLAPLPDNFD